jgi:tetratricopeptide (TPR) repeat protein
MGSCAHLTGDLAGAVALAEEGLLVARSIDATNLIGPLINNLGAALQAAGELEQAAAILEESLRLRRASGDIEGEAFSLANLGENAARRGDHRRAASYARGAYELFARLGEHNGAMAAGNLAAALIELGDSIGALRILGALDATGLTFGPAADAEYDDAARRARASSDPAAADAAWALGRAERIGAAVRAADRRA